MRSRTLSRLRSWLFLAALSLTASTRLLGAPLPPTAQDIARAEQAATQAREATAKHGEQPAVWGIRMMTEFMLLNVRTLAAGRANDSADFKAEAAALRRRVFDEWKQARPQDAAPYLAELGSVPAEQQNAALLALLPRFPDDPLLLGRLLPIFEQREDATRAGEMIDAAQRRHPENPDLWALLLRFQADQGNVARQREIAEAWLQQQPGEARALQAWLTQNPDADPRTSAAHVEQWLAASPVDGARIETCGTLLTTAHGAFADTARRCLADAAAHAPEPGLRDRAATLGAAALATDGNVDALAATLGSLSDAQRFEAVANAAASMRERACPTRWTLLELAPWNSAAGLEQPENWFRLLQGCETFAPARAAFLAALEQAPVEHLPALAGAWFVNVNGRYQEDFGLAPHMVPILEQRLARERTRANWEALDLALDLGGLHERRAAHVESWLASDAGMSWARPLEFLISYAEQESNLPRLERALRFGMTRFRDPRFARELGDLLLLAGRSDDLAALLRDLDGSAGDALAAAAPVIRAHAALARGRGSNDGIDAALTEYRRYAVETKVPERKVVAEYLAVLAARRGGGTATAEATAICNRLAASGAQWNGEESPSGCAASLLHEQGEGEEALATLESAVARSPDDLRLQAQLAYTAERVGKPERAEQAYHRLLAADAQNLGAWMGLARIAALRKDTAELEGLLRQSESALQAPQPELVIALARAYLGKGQPRRAIDLLEPLRQRLPDYGVAVIELRNAYAELGAAQPRPPVTVRAEAIAGSPVGIAATTAAHLPTAEHLAAMREIDAVLLGLSGHVDERRARALIEAQAAAGNPYAAVRLAVLQQAGTLGFTANLRQAAATPKDALPLVRAAAEAGEPYAQYLWGTALLRGLGVQKQPAEASAWLRKAAERGEPGAWFNLGYMARSGDGAALDPAAAVAAYRKAAQAGHAGAMNQLARLLLSGPDAVQNRTEGAQWLQKSAERGEPDSVSWWGARLMYGFEEVEPQPQLCRTWLEQGVALGQERSRYDLALALLAGVGGPRDERRGGELLRQSAEAGNARAMLQLVWQHTLGRGVTRDARAAAEWTEKAAALGDDSFEQLFGASADQPAFARAYFDEGRRELDRLAGQGDALAGGLLARLYFMGIGVAEDDARALILARKAAAEGSAEAMRTLGWAYRQGLGVGRDAEMAQLWWKRGAESGNSFCMMWLSQMLFNGEGGVKDPRAALAWLERSATIGNYWATHDLARAYDEGREGLAPDAKAAELWMRKAAAAGNEEAQGWLRAHRLNP